MTTNVSALITNYKTWDLTRHCISELLHWSSDCLSEILVIDDASNELISDSFPNQVRVIWNEYNEGYAACVNKGFANINSEFVLLLDSDAYPLMDVAQPIQQLFTMNPSLGALGFHLVDKQGRPTGASSPEPHAIALLFGQRLEAQLYNLFIKSEQKTRCLHSCGMAIRKKAFIEIDGFDEEFDFLDADIDFSIRLRSAGWQIEIAQDLRVFHEGGGSPQTTAERVLRHHRNRWRLLKKHGHLKYPWLFKVGLGIRHTVEYFVLRSIGRQLIPDAVALDDKIRGRQQLIQQVWSGYGNDYRQR